MCAALKVSRGLLFTAAGAAAKAPSAVTAADTSAAAVAVAFDVDLQR
jgi:hypothetical protein